MGEQTQKQSRNGKKPVALEKGVSVSISGQKITVKGPKGELSREMRPEVTLAQENGQVVVRPAEGAGQAGAQFQGLTRALVASMAEGVSKGFTRSLDFRGVGYRAEMIGKQLKMTVGLSHTPMIEIPDNVSVKITQIDEAGIKFPRVALESVSKETVGRVAARIRSMRPPEPYKGKGVRYTGERIKEKAGKAGKA